MKTGKRGRDTQKSGAGRRSGFLARPRSGLSARLQNLRDAQASPDASQTAQIKDLQEQVSSLHDASRSKDEFIRITNHELRTPLDVIRGNIDMVLKGETGALPERTREYLADALMGADRLTKLVNDMLDISRIESGRMKFSLEPIKLSDILQTIQKEFEPVFKRKDIVFTLRYPDTLPPVFSDAMRIFQVIDNFLGNALKFTPAGGHVTVTAREEHEMLTVSVQDTGIGVRAEDRGKLFKRFPQIDMGLLDVQRGTGLGLNLVHQLVEKLGGEVWMESPGLGRGATFSFRLPQAGSPRAAALHRFHERFLAAEAEAAHAGRGGLLHAAS